MTRFDMITIDVHSSHDVFVDEQEEPRTFMKYDKFNSSHMVLVPFISCVNKLIRYPQRYQLRVYQQMAKRAHESLRMG